MAELAKGEPWLDTEYQELEPLFLQMANQLDGDLYWVEHGDPKEMKEMKDPEFLHEAPAAHHLQLLDGAQNETIHDIE